MNVKHAEAAVRLLRLVLAGEMDALRALDEWPQSHHREDTLDGAWHDLSHFAADGDIRSKDARYAQYQTELLRSRIAEIERVYSLG